MRQRPLESPPQSNGECIERTDAAALPFTENRYTKYQFQRESILLNVPESSGVYGLFSALWIYIGEAENLRERLLEHLDGDNPCILHYQPSGFAFELASPTDRRCWHQELVMELQPLCSGRAFVYRAGQ